MLKNGKKLVIKFYQFLLIIVFLIFSQAAWALVPLESLVLGDFTEGYSEAETDPLNYVYALDKNQVSDISFKREVALYRGFYDEGKNIQNYCKSTRKIVYSSEWKKVQVMRSILSEIQYIGLDITSRALPQYAKKLEFSKDEYTNLVDGLVGNFCSSNLSVISKKELKNNLMVKFNKENNFNLPSIINNPYFPNNFDSAISSKNALENEFKYTVKLFQSICSWGGNPQNPGLLVPILKNPALMSFFFRQLNNRSIEWKPSNNTLFLNENKNTVQVVCDNLICRKTTPEIFFQKIYYSIGGTNLYDDYKRLYCEEFRLADFRGTDNDKRLAKIMDSRNSDEENFVNSQFIALLTGVPDILLMSEKFSQAENLFRLGVDYTWDKWAKQQAEMKNRVLYFEEPLTFELVERQLYFSPRKSKLKVSFDINLGEFDRINQRTGKIRASFNILLQRSFLHYYRQTLKEHNPLNTVEKDRLLKRFKIQMTKDIFLAREKFIIPPWKGDLESLLASELSEQLLLIPDEHFLMPKTGFEAINIEINYGLFALKYINHQKTVKNARDKMIKENSK